MCLLFDKEYFRNDPIKYIVVFVALPCDFAFFYILVLLIFV